MPDLFCRMLGGQVVVTDCRPVSRADEKFRRKAVVTAAACSHLGWDYRLVGEPNPVWGRLLSDPEWGNYIDSREGPRLIPFIDITDDYECSVA